MLEHASQLAIIGWLGFEPQIKFYDVNCSTHCDTIDVYLWWHCTELHHKSSVERLNNR